MSTKSIPPDAFSVYRTVVPETYNGTHGSIIFPWERAAQNLQCRAFPPRPPASGPNPLLPSVPAMWDPIGLWPSGSLGKGGFWEMYTSQYMGMGQKARMRRAENCTSGVMLSG